MTFEFDTIVIGAGHAGCEAAHAAATLGCRTLLITHDMNKIAQMSCNPAIGGIAKGQIVREIDALGGMTGIVTDRSSIQFRMLNRSKGPAVWSPRSQCDRVNFIKEWRRILENTPNLSIWQDSVTELIIDHRKVEGVKTTIGVEFRATTVILTAGTFLNGLMHIGRTMWEGGRISEPASHGLTEQLKNYGIESQRMKTGTPVRIDGRSVKWNLTQPQPGDETPSKFSFIPKEKSGLIQRSCYTVNTNPTTHEILRSGLADSPLYNGQIKSIGPRYCPSIETKIVTFADRDSHQLHLEPEGENTNEYYLNGFSSSLPVDIQINALKTIPALSDVVIYRPGYAIEYDFFDPTQLHHTLESKIIEGLFFAGQVNGTTGYEEAAGQGLMAGINAAKKIKNEEPLVLHRDQAYIGVLIDDLVTKGVDEPYRMFTSRAEHRILLRQDDADRRLTPIGHEIGLATDERYNIMLTKKNSIEYLTRFMKEYSIRPEDVNTYLQTIDSSPIIQSQKLFELLLRPNVNIKSLMEILHPMKEIINSFEAERRDEIIEATEIEAKYSGYIEREKETAQKMHRLEHIGLSPEFDYNSIKALSTEARQKLTHHKPLNIGQASRIPGVSPSDINILLLTIGR